MKKDLDEIFYSHTFLAGDLPKFWKIVRQKTDYDYTDAKRYYENQEIVQVYKPYKLDDPKEESKGHIVTDEPFKKFYMDTMYFGKLGFALINGIDLFSRYGFAKTFSWKRNTEEGVTSKDATKAIKEFLLEIKNMGYDLITVTTDRGSEFKNEFRDFLLKNKIVHYVTDAGDHKQLGVCERFNGTIRTMIEKYISIYGKSVRNDIPLILDVYNNRIHSTTGYAPKFILQNLSQVHRMLLDKYYSQDVIKKEEELKNGTKVRILLRSLDQPFRKKGENWTKEIYTVEKYSKTKGKYLVNG